jgi:NAD(P)H-dependent FMN reductase|tara:strand:- start:7 stop:528 length:522 start_codon:yes stop_codon:yes gene_type:complete
LAKVVVISGSPRKNGKTPVLMKHVFGYVKQKNPDVKMINLSEGGIDYYMGDGNVSETTREAAKDITEADIWLIGTPIYNSFFSAALKNLFEYIDYKKTEGKAAGLVVLASSNSGFVDVQTLLTQLMSYFNVITNPRAVFVTANTIQNDQIVDDDVKARLETMVDSTLELGAKI